MTGFGVGAIRFGGHCRLSYLGFVSAQGAGTMTFDISAFPTADVLILCLLVAPDASVISPAYSPITYTAGANGAGVTALIASQNVTPGTTSYVVSATGRYLMGVALGYKCFQLGDRSAAPQAGSGGSTIQVPALTPALPRSDYIATAMYFGDSAATSSVPDAPLEIVTNESNHAGGNYYFLSVARARLPATIAPQGPFTFTTDFPAVNPALTGSVRTGLGLILDNEPA